MNTTDERRNPIEVLAEEFLGRYRRGENPSFTEYTGRHPELAGEILEVFSALAIVEEANPLGGPPARARPHNSRAGAGLRDGWATSGSSAPES